MALETGTYISDLVATNPPGSDGLAQADNHLRLIKSTIQATFPNLTGAMTATHTILNGLDGRVTTIEADYVKDTGDTLTGSWNASAATWVDLGAVTAADLNGGTIDNMAIGGTTPAAGTFTVLAASGAVTFSSTVGLSADPTTALQAATKQYVDDAPAVIYGITGLEVSHAVDTDHDLTIAAGSVSDTTRSKIITLSSAITKQIDAVWAVGTNQGGLDTGTVAADTWYHIWLIMRSDTGVVDVLFSTSATSPTMPTNYDYKQRIGARLTDGTANFIQTTQLGDTVLYLAQQADVDDTTSSTTAKTAVVSVPTGLKIEALLRAAAYSASLVNCMLVSSPDVTDVAPTNATGYTASPAYNSYWGWNDAQIRTDTSGQVRYRTSAVDVDIKINTLGWIDPRGRY